MSPEQWQQIDQLFHAALERAPDERAAWLATASQGDAELQHNVAALLVAHEEDDDGVWAASPSEIAAQWLNDQGALPSLIGQQISHYQIESLLGRGGMGEVWRAHDTHLNRAVALKVLPAEFAQDADRLRRFEQEARAISALNHPNILTIHEIGQQDNQHYIITEFIDGESLRQRLHGARLPAHEAIDIAIQIASALAAAQQAGVVHRDIKPENVMIRSDEFVKVLDFGLAKLSRLRNADFGMRIEDADTLLQAAPNNPQSAIRIPQSTAPGMVMGTPYYMSPEQARGLAVDARTDIWSLGCVLFEMVTGQMAFAGPTTSDIIAAILQKEPLPVGEAVPELPAELGRIVRKALSKDRAVRYQTVNDMASDLKRLHRQLAFEVELERREPSADRRASQAAVTAESHREAATVSAVAKPTAEQVVAHTSSSAEYVVSEIKRHKLGTLIALLAVIAMTAAAYLYFAPSSKGQIQSIVVLPFANTSGDPNMEYLSDGLSESLINALAQLPSVKVIGRGSSFRYKGKEVEPEELARALGVQAIVTGRVAQHGDNLQVSAELMDVRDQTQMWGEQYNRKAADVLQVQAEISRQIVEKLRLRLTSKEQQQLVKGATANPQAYELLLRGRFHRYKRTADDLKKAFEYFNHAIAIDPNYALAHAYLAEIYRLVGTTSAIDPRETTPKAEAAARRALALDESLAEAHYALAVIKQDAWDWAEAERAFKRALELNPNLPVVHSGYAYFLSTQGRHGESLAAIKQAKELDPLALGINANLGYRLYFARQYDLAIEQLKKTLELDRNYGFAHYVLGYAYAASGRYADAIAEYKETIRLQGDSSSTQCYLGYALAQAGQRRAAEAILKQLETGKEYVSPAELALLYVGLGETEKALSALERAYAVHDLQMQYLGIDPHYDGLRSDPRFTDLLRRVGLPQ